MAESKKSRQRMVEEGCIWMKAGVVDYKLCNNYFDCPSCQYDKAMTKIAEENRTLRAAGKQPDPKKAHIITWREAMRAKPAELRFCRHTLTGRIGDRRCAYAYDCQACDFDQFFEDEWEISVPMRLVDIPQIRGYKVPQGFYYHDGHAWAKIEPAGRIRIGLDDFGLKLVGPLEKLDLPHVGYETKKNAPSWSLFRKGNEAEILAPSDGVVIAVNPKVRQRPDLSNGEPYEDGWIMVIQPSNLKGDIKTLHFGEEAGTFIESESDKLFKVVEEVTGPLPADGGQLVTDVYGNLPSLGWERLTKTFFRS